MTKKNKHGYNPTYQEGFTDGVYSHEDTINIPRATVAVRKGRHNNEWYRGYLDGRRRRNGHPR